MKGKIISFFKAIGYVAIAYIIQTAISIGYGFFSMFRIISEYSLGALENSEEEIFLIFMNKLNEDMNLILLISAIIYVLALILIYKIGKKSVIKDFGLKNHNRKNYILALGLGVAVWLINTGFVSIVQASGLLKSHFQVFEELTSSITQGSMLMMILSVGIVAPFAEEFLFRGIIQRTLSKSMSITSAIIIQGIFFGIYHGNIIQGIYATFLGIVFGYVTFRCKSIWPAVIMHMVNNTVAVTASNILPESLNSMVGYIVLASIGTIILVISLGALNKNNSILQVENEVINLS